jgi:hypothetical protein
MTKLNSHATRGDLTPQDYDEILQRVQIQLEHDGEIKSLEITPGLEHYVLRQIVFYSNQVKRERRRWKK